MKKPKALVALSLAWLLIGCAYSLSEIRSYEPQHTLTSSKPPEELAKCIELRARAELTGRWYEVNPAVALEEHPDKTYHIALTLPGYTAIADILVKPIVNGSAVEYRRKSWWSGQARLLEIMEQCAR